MMFIKNTFATMHENDGERHFYTSKNDKNMASSRQVVTESAIVTPSNCHLPLLPYSLVNVKKSKYNYDVTAAAYGRMMRVSVFYNK